GADPHAREALRRGVRRRRHRGAARRQGALREGFPRGGDPLGRERGSRTPLRGPRPMKTIVVTQREVPALLPMKECVDLMARVLETTSRGDAVLPLRSMVWLPDRSGLLGLMPAYLGDPKVLGLKLVSVFPGNHGTPYDSHQGVVVLFEVEHG